jgi:MFS family permease
MTGNRSNPTLPEDRIPLGRKLAVGVGGFPFLSGGMAVQYLAQPIYQIFLGLNPVLFGLAMTIPRFVDAFTDPVMGMVSDRFRSRWGRRRRLPFRRAKCFPKDLRRKETTVPGYFCVTLPTFVLPPFSAWHSLHQPNKHPTCKSS